MLIKRSFSIAGHRTSIALEPEFWDALEAVARDRGEPLASLILAVDAERSPARPLASALRVHALHEAARLGAPAQSDRQGIVDQTQ